MKICILYHSFFGETGGAGVTTYLRNLKRHLEARGHRVYIISARVKENEEKRFYYAPSISIWPLRAFTGNLTFLFSSFLKLIKVNRKERFDLIYTIGASGAFSPIIKRVLNKPIVHHLVVTWQTGLHNIENKWDLKEYAWFIPLIPLNKLSALNADKIITLCTFFKKEAIKYYNLNEERIVVIPNGVDIPERREMTTNVREKYGIHEKDIVFLFVGGTQKRKGINELIKAFNLANIPNKKLIIVGEITKDFQLSYKNKDFKGKVILAGRVSNEILKGIYSCSDIFVLPTKWEGQPIAVLEAMSYGLPIITTGKYGMVDQVDDGVTGFLLPSWNPKDIAAKMEKIVTMDYKKMGELSREKAEREFSWPSVADRTIKVFEEVVRGHGR